MHRNGKLAYHTPSAVAIRMVLQGLAQRRGQTMIELPSNESPENLGEAALVGFNNAKPEYRCFGAHTSANQDRMTYAPCFYHAATGHGSSARSVYMKGNYNDATPGHQGRA